MAALTVMFHFHKFYIGNRLDQIAGRFINAGCSADMTGVMPGNLYRFHIIRRKFEFAGFDFLSYNFRVVPCFDVVFNAQLLRPFRINNTPHHVAGRAGGNNCIRSGMFDNFNISPHIIRKKIPFTSYQHGCAAAILRFSGIGKINAGAVEQSDGSHADIMFHIAYRTSGKIYCRSFAAGTMLFHEVLRKPVCSVFAVTRPDIALGT